MVTKPKQPKNVFISTNEGQISLEQPMWFNRYLPFWGTPTWLQGEKWRNFVRNQPIAMTCRETIIANLMSLDFQVIARDSTYRDELKEDIDYYTKGLESRFGISYDNHVEWIVQDLLDLPFGGISEIGKDSSGKVVWIEPLDGTTCYPTLNDPYPVAQYVPEVSVDTVYFPKDSISRIYLTARPELLRKGWGMPPIEKVFLALELLNRGDYYYSQLLLDTPQAGILDLGDMEREAAKNWVMEFKSMMGGIDPLKIPVLYEHNTDVKYMPFGRPPSEIMYNQITLKYAAIMCAGYGLSLSDIGLSTTNSSGETLAGTIRQERRTRKTGFASVKRKVISYFNSILPDTLQFKLIDYDDELNIAVARARLANSQAFTAWMQGGIFSNEELRLQAMADGLVSIPLPEKPPKEALQNLDAPLGLDTGRNKQVGNPVPVSVGGHGDVKKAVTIQDTNVSNFEEIVKNVLRFLPERYTDLHIRKLLKKAIVGMFPQIKQVVKSLTSEEMELWDEFQDLVLFNKTDEEDEIPEVVTKALEDVKEVLQKELDKEPDWWKLFYSGLLADFYPIFEAEYLRGIRETNRSMNEFLYEDGLMPYPEEQSYKLENDSVIEDLRNRILAFFSNMNDGTAYYLIRVIMSVVRHELIMNPLFAQQVAEGISIEDLLANQALMNQLINAVRSELYDLVYERSSVASWFELHGVYHSAVEKTYDKIGLTKKRWKTFSEQPCDYCIRNESQGFVELDFEYESPMGTTILQPLAHPHCACELLFDRDELVDIVKSGKLNLWYGQ